MSIELDDALQDYEGSIHASSGRKAILKSNQHIKHRGKYPKHAEKPQPDGFGCWYSEIVRVRSSWLVQNKPQLAKDWQARKNDYCLGTLARKYVYDDYQISPRVARMIIYHALERLVDKKELAGADVDDEYYYNVVNRKFFEMSRRRAAGSSSSGNGQAGRNGKPRGKIKSRKY